MDMHRDYTNADESLFHFLGTGDYRFNPSRRYFSYTSRAVVTSRVSLAG